MHGERTWKNQRLGTYLITRTFYLDFDLPFSYVCWSTLYSFVYGKCPYLKQKIDNVAVSFVGTLTTLITILFNTKSQNQQKW